MNPIENDESSNSNFSSRQPDVLQKALFSDSGKKSTFKDHAFDLFHKEVSEQDEVGIKMMNLIDKLNVSCKAGNMDEVEHYVEKLNVPLNVRDRWDATPLYYACLCGHYELVKYLLRRGARCAEGTFDGERCLYAAHTPEIRNILREFKVIILRDAFHDFFRSVLNDRSSADVTFFIKGEKLYAHRIVLSARSPFFRDKFQTKWKDRSEIHIRNKLMNPHVFRAVIRYIYTEQTEVPSKYKDNCLLLVKQCQLPHLRDSIEQSLQTQEESSEWIIVEPPKPQRLTIGKYTPAQLHFLSILEQVLPPSLRKDQNNRSINEFADIVLQVQGEKFYCHKLFVCLGCEYLQVLLNNRFKEGLEQKIDEVTGLPIQNVQNVTPQVFAAIIGYIYTGTLINEDPNILVEVMIATEMFLLFNLKNLVASSLVQYIDSSNVWDFIQLSRLYNSQRLEDMCIRWIARNLQEVIDTKELYDFVKESAFSIQKRQEADSIPVIDELRTYIDEDYADLEDCEWTEENLNRLQEKQKKLKEIDKLLEFIGIEG